MLSSRKIECHFPCLLGNLLTLFGSAPSWSSQGTTMKHPRARPQSGGDALASNCTYTSYVVSRSALNSMTINAANSLIPNHRQTPINTEFSIPRTQSSIRSMKCQRVHSHHRCKQASHGHSNAATSEPPRETDEVDQTDVCIIPTGAVRKVKVSSTRKSIKKVRRNTFRQGPVPFGVRMMNQIADLLVGAFVSQRHMKRMPG